MIKPRKVIVLRVVVGAENTPEDVQKIREQVFDAVCELCYDTLDTVVRDMTEEEVEDYLHIYGDDYIEDFVEEQKSKSEKMVETLDGATKMMFGRTRSESIASSICVICGGDAHTFTDELSRKEYDISGLCQKCQDSLFEKGE